MDNFMYVLVLCIVSAFNYALNHSGYIKYSDRMINKWIEKDVKGSGRGLV